MNAFDISLDLAEWALIYYIDTGNRIKASKIMRLANKYKMISEKKISA